MPSLTSAERETVILMDDESPDAIITTYQRPLINRLRKNTAAVEQSDEKLAKWGGACFRIPAKLVNVRNPRKPSTRKPSPAGNAAERMARARAARGK